jgi:predicted acetyltransferase
MQLVVPSAEHLAAYAAALQRGWSPDNIRGAAAAQEELERIAQDPGAFLAWGDDPEGRGPLVTLADGSQVPRLPGLRRWMWDNGPGLAEAERFIGSINLRWMRGHAALPPHVLGHIGYGVVPWHAGRGHATQALAGVLALARMHGLPLVELTTDPDNLASQKVITRNGGVLVEHFNKGPIYGNKPGLRYRITLL